MVSDEFLPDEKLSDPFFWGPEKAGDDESGSMMTPGGTQHGSDSEEGTPPLGKGGPPKEKCNARFMFVWATASAAPQRVRASHNPAPPTPRKRQCVLPYDCPSMTQHICEGSSTGAQEQM